MRILFVGDVVGRPGRDAVVRLTPTLRAAHGADVVIVNGENAAGGNGITREIALALYAAGVDVITLGNHAWAKREVYGYLDEEPRILRPGNYPQGAPGRGMGVYQSRAGTFAVAVFQGRTFMEPTENPFLLAERVLRDARQYSPIVIIDFHGEATSEKQAFSWHVDGSATAVIGTHTHVQTADERILPGGTACISDVGMTGPTQSIIGMSKESVLPRFITQLPSRFEVAAGPVELDAVLVEADSATGRALSISRVKESALAVS